MSMMASLFVMSEIVFKTDISMVQVQNLHEYGFETASCILENQQLQRLIVRHSLGTKLEITGLVRN